MTAKKKDADTAAVAGCFVLVGGCCAAIGIGYIFGAGFGWLSFAAFLFASVLRHHLRKDRVAA